MSFGNASPGRDNKNIWAIGVRPAGEAVKYDSDKKEFVPVASGVSATDLDFSSDGKWVTYVAHSRRHIVAMPRRRHRAAPAHVGT